MNVWEPLRRLGSSFQAEGVFVGWEAFRAPALFATFARVSEQI